VNGPRIGAIFLLERRCHYLLKWTRFPQAGVKTIAISHRDVSRETFKIPLAPSHALDAGIPIVPAIFPIAAHAATEFAEAGNQFDRPDIFVHLIAELPFDPKP
jgi:hypothetical protein